MKIEHPLITLVGGIRAAIFAGLALVLLVAVGVQTWRLHTSQTAEARLQAAVADWRASQTTNLGTIKVLRSRLASLAAARALEAQRQADEVKAAQAAAKAAQRALAARNRQLEKLYANDPEAARWGSTAVPAGVLQQLPAGSD